MRQKAFRSFPNRYPFSLYYEVISSFSIRYNLEIILRGKNAGTREQECWNKCITIRKQVRGTGQTC